MAISTVLTIAGIAVTVIFGGYSIYLFVRTQKYPGQITFVKKTCIGLFDAFVRNLSDLSILYQNEPVGENLVLLKGCFANTGNKDILPEMVEEQISIKLPKNYRWLAVTIDSASSQVSSQAEIDNAQKISFSFGLFRCHEHFHFEAIVEVPETSGADHSKQNPADELLAAMKFRHRIADTQKINRQEVQSDTQLRELKNHQRILMGQVTVFFIFFIVFGGIIWWKGKPVQIHYILTMDDSQEIEVTISPQSDGSVKIGGVDEDYGETLPIETAFKDRKLRPIIVTKSFLFPLIITSIMILILIVSLAVILTKKRRDNSLRKTLGIPSSTSATGEEGGVV